MEVEHSTRKKTAAETEKVYRTQQSATTRRLVVMLSDAMKKAPYPDYDIAG